MNKKTGIAAIAANKIITDKKKGYNLHHSIEIGYFENDLDILEYADAWVNGYDIKEPLYTTAFMAHSMGVFLYKENEEVCYGDNMRIYRKEYKIDPAYRLTKKEIIDFDPRFWKTAEPI